MTHTGHSLDWIDSFIDRIRPYIHVRLTDSVLIRMPNEAYKLNETGARLIHFLLTTGKVADILAQRPDDRSLPNQLQSFFSDLSRLLSGPVCDRYESPSLDRVPFTLGYITLPVLSELAITSRCNIRCAFCYASCRCTSDPSTDPDHSRELTTAQFKDILTKIRREAEVPSVSFTGGEPLLRPDLPELIRYAARTLHMRVNLITNGTLITPAIAQTLHREGLASAQVSIESSDPEIHDRITGVTGSWEKSVSGLNALAAADVHVHPHTTICRMNQNTIAGMAAFAKNIGIPRFSANMMIPAGRGIDPQLGVTYSELSDILHGVIDAAESAGVRFMWYSPTPLCLFNPIAHQLGNKGCSACEGLLSVDPAGQILPCSSWREPLGSLLDRPFREIWFSDRSRFLRKKQAAPPECRKCAHFPVCHGACPLYFNIHGYHELDTEWRRIGEAVCPSGKLKEMI